MKLSDALNAVAFALNASQGSTYSDIATTESDDMIMDLTTIQADQAKYTAMAAKYAASGK